MLETSAECYEFRDFRLDVARRQLLKNGEALPLNQKAFHILLLLVRHHGRVLAKNAIIDEIWRDSFVEDANLTQHIYILRKTLEDAASNNDPIIRTVPKQGYMFAEPVTLSTPPGNGRANVVINEPALIEPNGHHDGNGHTPPHASSLASILSANDVPRANDRRVPTTLISLAIFVVAAIAVIAASRYGVGPAPDGKRINSIAVVPFKSVSGNDEAKLGLGMADAVISKLSKLRNVQVRPTSAVFRYVDQKDADVETVGRGLGVEAVLEGTLQIDSDRIRVNVQLVDVKENRPLWAEHFDERSTDVFSVQDAIAARVATSLNENLAALAPLPAKTGPAASPDAYQKYLLGLYSYNKRSKEALERAENYLTDAIRVDPQYAPAHAILADVYNMQIYYRFIDDREERGTRAGAEAQTALNLDEQSPEAHISMAQYLAMSKWTPDKARERRRHLERAIELAPSNSTAHLRYAWVLYEDNRIDDAEAQVLLAQKSDPLSPVTNGAACDILMLGRRFEEGLNYCQKSYELEPTTPGARERVANGYLKLGQIDKAIELIKQDIAQVGENPGDRSLLALFYARSGRTDEARKMLPGLIAAIDKQPDIASSIALTYKALNEDATAREWLQRAVKTVPSLRMRLRYDADYDAFHKDPHLKEILPSAAE